MRKKISFFIVPPLKRTVTVGPFRVDYVTQSLGIYSLQEYLVDEFYLYYLN